MVNSLSDGRPKPTDNRKNASIDNGKYAKKATKIVVEILFCVKISRIKGEISAKMPK